METPTPDAVMAEIVRLVAERAGPDAPPVQPTFTLKDSGLSSLDAIELLFEIEEHFNVELAGEGPNLADDTVQNLADAVSEALAAAALKAG